MNIRKHFSTRLAIRSLVIALAAGVVPVVAATTSAQAAPYCGITWGSLAKSSSTMVTGPLTNVRAGRHACFDRLVIDLRGKAPGYSVRYVSAVRTEGEGKLVPLRGGAKLLVVTRAPAYTATGAPSYTPANPRELVNVTGYTTFRQAAWAGSFEGQTSIGLGVRARLPFRVFTIHDSTGSRLVIDVAHRW
jgi:hypothetical protein